ncbi:hypothetical protein [Actibacterium atlanticum]|uniref:hypothetical protein n=1 Tax=Actibacterium atlanticum TaxID=1461693 RepID=UPI0012DEB894|nr:hypothetical protein [Actibacterium atlanticum]
MSIAIICLQLLLGRGSIIFEIASSWLHGIALYFFHATMIFGDTGPRFRVVQYVTKPSRRFWSAFAIYAAIIYLGTTLITYSVSQLLVEYFTLAWELAALLGIALSMLGLWLFLAAFGTVIPAAVARQSLGRAEIVRRAKLSFFSTLWRLLVGPTLVGTCIVWLSIRYHLTMDIEVNPTPIAVLGRLTMITAFFYPTAMVAVILSRALSKAENTIVLQYPPTRDHNS